jgi:hypothetical protein
MSAKRLVEDDDLLSSIVDGLLKKGVKSEKIEAHLEKALPSALPKAGQCLLKELKRTAAGMLIERRVLHAEFRTRLHKTWKRGLDLARALLEAAREAGEGVNARYRPAAAKKHDLVFDALVRLHARACLVATEVIWLMEGGFASGAQARWRTLHEIAVVAFFISAKGQQVAERYLLHDVVESYRAGLQYQEFCKPLGRRPLSANHLKSMKREYDRLCQRFGKAYGGDWGWAADALGSARPSFADIEGAVQMRHYRPYVRLACISNHAGCKGIRFDLGSALPSPWEEMLLAGPSNAGLFDPGTCTVFSLVQVTTVLVVHCRPRLEDLVAAEALRQLAGEVEAALAASEQRQTMGANKLMKPRGRRSR